jgi:hypothetical protein
MRACCRFVFAAVAVAAAAAATSGGCTRVVDAVTLQDCAHDPAATGCEPGPWPTPAHTANSDPWLVSHRTVITEIRPRVLVLNFQNGVSVDSARQTAERQVRAVAEGSRYHGYTDASAPPFVRYEIAKVVDLTDAPPPSGWTFPSSTLLPTGSTGEFDVQALFSSQFADRYGFPDPKTPARSLSLCELFEQGIINEVWIQDGEASVRRAPLSLERKQGYDNTETAIPGSFAPDTGGGGRLENILCGVTVRLAHLDAVRGPGCDLEVRGWEIESMWEALPSLRADALAFLNGDFIKRFGVRFDNWAVICDKVGTPCITYPTATSARGSYPDDGTPWSISPFRQGCGSTEFPPNATRRGDMYNDTPVESRCEHFGLGDAPDRSDTYEPYSYATKVAALEQAFPDCGGGWQIYWRQSIPGYGNRARNADGTPMKNWWPLLFY